MAQEGAYIEFDLLEGDVLNWDNWTAQPNAFSLPVEVLDLAGRNAIFKALGPFDSLKAYFGRY